MFWTKSYGYALVTEIRQTPNFVVWLEKPEAPSVKVRVTILPEGNDGDHYRREGQHVMVGRERPLDPDFRPSPDSERSGSVECDQCGKPPLNPPKFVDDCCDYSYLDDGSCDGKYVAARRSPAPEEPAAAENIPTGEDYDAGWTVEGEADFADTYEPAADSEPVHEHDGNCAAYGCTGENSSETGSTLPDDGQHDASGGAPEGPGRTARPRDWIDRMQARGVDVERPTADAGEDEDVRRLFVDAMQSVRAAHWTGKAGRDTDAAFAALDRLIAEIARLRTLVERQKAMIEDLDRVGRTEADG